MAAVWKALSSAALAAGVLLAGAQPALSQALQIDYPYPPVIYGNDGAFLAGVQRMRIRHLLRGLDWRLSARSNALRMDGAPGVRAGVTPVAGESDGPLGNGWTVWSMYVRSWMKDRRAAIANKGASDSLTLGIDRELGERITAGVSLNYVHTSLDTLYNAGTSKTDGITVSPYASIALTDWLTLEVTGGYVYNREKTWRTLPVAATGRRHSNGYMFGTSLSAAKWFDSVLLSAKVGLVITRDRWKAYVESDGTPHSARVNRLVQGSMEGSVSWWLDPVMPYAAIAWTYDLSTNDPLLLDRDDVTFTGGIAWYGSGRWEGLTADLSGSIVVGRRKQRDGTVSVGLRWNF